VRTIFHVLDKGGTPEGGAQAIRDFLQQSYDGNLRVGSWHRAPSEWWRNELEFLPQPKPERWVNRIHIFEDGPCVHGRYIGYAHLRPPGFTNPPPGIADAFLAPPLRLLTSNYSLMSVNLTELSQIYGEPYFCCLPYAMAVEELGGFCAHACLYMAMLMMMPYDSHPAGPLDIALRLVLPDQYWGPKIEPATLVQPTGLLPKQSLRALRHRDCHLWGLAIAWDIEELDASHFLNLLRQHVEAGIPVILHVHFARLYRRPIPDDQACHAVLLVGNGRTKDGQQLFVYHDPVVGPYLEVTWSGLADSLYLFKDRNSTRFTQPVAIAVSPGSIPQSAKTPEDADTAEDLPIVRYPLRKCHQENGFETVEWRCELLAEAHCHRRISRLLTGAFGFPGFDTDVERSLRMLLPDTATASFMWMLSRPLPADQLGTFCYVYDATKSERAKARRIAWIYRATRDSKAVCGVRQGVDGYGREIYDAEGRPGILKIDRGGQEVRSCATAG